MIQIEIWKFILLLILSLIGIVKLFSGIDRLFRRKPGEPSVIFYYIIRHWKIILISLIILSGFGIYTIISFLIQQ